MIHFLIALLILVIGIAIYFFTRKKERKVPEKKEEMMGVPEEVPTPEAPVTPEAPAEVRKETTEPPETPPPSPPESPV